MSGPRYRLVLAGRKGLTGEARKYLDARQQAAPEPNTDGRSGRTTSQRLTLALLVSFIRPGSGRRLERNQACVDGSPVPDGG